VDVMADTPRVLRAPGAEDMWESRSARRGRELGRFTRDKVGLKAFGVKVLMGLKMVHVCIRHARTSEQGADGDRRLCRCAYRTGVWGKVPTEALGGTRVHSAHRV
jgi:hypothetical protein